MSIALLTFSVLGHTHTHAARRHTARLVPTNYIGLPIDVAADNDAFFGGSLDVAYSVGNPRISNVKVSCVSRYRFNAFYEAYWL